MKYEFNQEVKEATKFNVGDYIAYESAPNVWQVNRLVETDDLFVLLDENGREDLSDDRAIEDLIERLIVIKGITSKIKKLKPYAIDGDVIKFEELKHIRGVD